MAAMVADEFGQIVKIAYRENTERPPTEAALLFRLRVKRLSGFHLFDQLVGGLNRPRVYQLFHHLFQKANPPIDFDAFITHAPIAFARVSCRNSI
jgi:hypothetical protein